MDFEENIMILFQPWIQWRKIIFNYSNHWLVLQMIFKKKIKIFAAFPCFLSFQKEFLWTLDCQNKTARLNNCLTADKVNLFLMFHQLFMSGTRCHWRRSAALLYADQWWQHSLSYKLTQTQKVQSHERVHILSHPPHLILLHIWILYSFTLYITLLLLLLLHSSSHSFSLILLSSFLSWASSDQRLDGWWHAVCFTGMHWGSRNGLSLHRQKLKSSFSWL